MLERDRQPFITQEDRDWAIAFLELEARLKEEAQEQGKDALIFLSSAS